MDKQFFIDIDQAFKNAAPDFTAAGVKPIAFIDRFRGQPLNPEHFEYYELPAIFIQRTIKWEREGREYNANMELKFHLVTEPTWDMANISPNRDSGLQYYTFLDQVRNVLDNFKVLYMSSLFRDEDVDMDSGVVFYDILGYKCLYYGDSSLKPEYESDYSDTTNLNITARNNKIRNA